jgi:hypothetical protein
MTFVRDIPDTDKGMNLKLGDSFVLPDGWLTVSLDATQSKARFTRVGVSIYALELFTAGAATSPADVAHTLDVYLHEANAVIASSPLFEGLDRSSPADGRIAVERVGGKIFMKEHWALAVMRLTHDLRRLLSENAPAATVFWAVNQLTNAHAMLVYLRDIDNVTWTGHRVTEVRRLIEKWTSNPDNDKEAFWQTTFSDNAFVLSQVFALPVVIVQEKAYVGGKAVNNQGGKVADYLVSNELTGNTGIVEIKTPKTPLLAKTPYREGVYPVSPELVGSVGQALRYKDTLLKSLYTLKGEGSFPYDAFDPECVVIAGSYGQIDDPQRKASFELFRANLRHVRVVTFDELFTKVEALLRLFESAEDGAA